MNLDADQISKKNSVVTLVYALTFGYLGAHRFYVGKWKSGLVYLIFGSVFPLVHMLQKISEVLGVNFALKASGVFTIAYILVECAMLYDIFALYSQSFTDCFDKVVIGGSEKDEIVGRTMEEKFNDNLSIAVALFIFILIFIIYFVIL